MLALIGHQGRQLLPYLPKTETLREVDNTKNIIFIEMPQEGLDTFLLKTLVIGRGYVFYLKNGNYTHAYDYLVQRLGVLHRLEHQTPSSSSSADLLSKSGDLGESSDSEDPPILHRNYNPISARLKKEGQSIHILARSVSPTRALQQSSVLRV